MDGRVLNTTQRLCYIIEAVPNRTLRCKACGATMKSTRHVCNPRFRHFKRFVIGLQSDVEDIQRALVDVKLDAIKQMLSADTVAKFICCATGRSYSPQYVSNRLDLSELFYDPVNYLRTTPAAEKRSSTLRRLIAEDTTFWSTTMSSSDEEDELQDHCT